MTFILGLGKSAMQLSIYLSYRPEMWSPKLQTELVMQ